MSLYLITGQSGSGNSAVLDELRKREFTAYGTDENGIARHKYIESGKFFTSKDYARAEKHPINWVEDATLVIDPKRFIELEREARTKDVFICGGSDDQNQYYDKFDKVFALIVDPKTLRNRLLTRTNNPYGKKPHELAHILGSQKAKVQEFEKAGAILIEATKPVDKIADQILATTHK